MPEPFDPDRANADDVDPDDPDAISEWLNHPNTQAMYADLGRAFRDEPADVQITELRRMLANNEPKLQELTEALATRDYEPAARAALDQLHATMRSSIEAARARITELGG